MSLKVYLYPSDQWGCGHYRMIWPGRAVDEPGIDAEVVTPGSRKVSIHFDQMGRVAREDFPEDADVIVFQRPTSRFIAELVPMLQARGVAVVIELDDDLAHVHPANPAFEYLQPTIRHGRQSAPNMHDLSTLREALRKADMLIVSTDELAGSYTSAGGVRVIRNYIPRHYLDVQHVDSPVIGWGGSVHSHPDDLQQVGPAIANLVADGATFQTVGDPADVARVLGLRQDPDSTGPVPLESYPVAVARFGIGIAPLAPTRFNRCKSWLKGLEYAALGVPWVGSPLPEYQLLHDMGTGRLAAKPKHWTGALRALMASEALRAEMSTAGRQVAAALTVEGNAWRWAEVWAEAAKVRNRRYNTARGPGVVRQGGGTRGSLSQRARKLRR